MFVDSHCHLNMLNLDPYANDMSKLLSQGKQEGLEYVLCIGTTMEDSHEVIAIAEQHENVSASIGVHPSEKADKEPSVEDLVKLGSHPKVVAIGETGLDYYYNKEGLNEMRDRFRTHVRAARELKKPLIIHSRDAREDTLNILREEKASEIKGVMHCFTDIWEMAEAAMEIGFYVSFSGIVTFKNAKNVAEVAQKVPLEKMLIETDAPYLTPVPYRGKDNYPQYVRYVAEKIAELKGISFAEVVAQTTKNFYDLFPIHI